MAIDGFDYKSFAENMSEQALGIIPNDFSDEDKTFLCDTMLKFAKIAGEALDEANEFNSEQAEFITQLIAEWTFHKSVDLIKSGIPREFWEPALQRIAMVVFEVTKEGKRQCVDEDTICKGVEHVAEKTYKECCEDLKSNNLIDEETFENAINQSSIDDFSNTSDEVVLDNIPDNMLCISSSRWSIAGWGIFFTLSCLFFSWLASRGGEISILSIVFAIFALYFYIYAIFSASRFIAVDKDKNLLIYKKYFRDYRLKSYAKDIDIFDFKQVVTSPFPFDGLILILNSGKVINLYKNFSGNMKQLNEIKKLLVENYPNKAFTKSAFEDKNFTDYFSEGTFGLFYRLPNFFRWLIILTLIIFAEIGINGYYVTHIKEILDLPWALFAAANITSPFLVYLLILSIIDRKKLSEIPDYVKGVIIVCGIIFLFLFFHFING